MTMELNLLGLDLKSPYIAASCPVSYNAEGIIRAFRAGAGAVVTKTIRDTAADNPYPHITLAGKDTLINAEKWSDIEPARWIEKEIPQAREAGVTLIASLGHTEREVDHWAVEIERAGADALELVSYTEEAMIPMIKSARRQTSLPIIAKISPNWAEPVTSAVRAVEAGADAITAIDSLGPVLRMDIYSGKPLVGGAKGEGWLTGEAIRPLAQAIVAGVAARTDVPVIGLGGVLDAEDGVEMLMSGATAVGICSSMLVKGINYLGELNRETEKLITELGYTGTAEISEKALQLVNRGEVREKFTFDYDQEKCTACNRCVDLCPYQARDLENKVMELATEKCRYCGYCASVCPVGALTIIEE